MYKTGQKAPATGRYRFAGYTDAPPWPAPTAEEQVIPLSAGEVFPPIRSSRRAAYWTAA